MSSTMDALRRAGPALVPALAGAALLAVLAAPAPADRPLSERVVIRRDTFGVPHVLAEDEEAAAFGLGFAMAEDHATEMGRRYLAARGESARNFGEEGIEDDFAALRLDTRWRARRALQELGDGFRRWLAGFAAGYFSSRALGGLRIDSMASARVWARTSAMSARGTQAGRSARCATT